MKQSNDFRRRALLVTLLALLGVGAWALLERSSPETAQFETAQPRPPSATASAAPRAPEQSNETVAAGAIIAYRSTMLAGEISQTPRKDSMGMDMVPVYASNSSMLELSEHARAMAGVETVVVRRREMNREIRAVGKVQFNETGLANITSRVEGYVERLFVDYTGVEVKPGDHLVEIYSPDLLVAQQELLVALEAQRNSSLAESAQRKLRLLGLTQQQVDDLVTGHKVSDRITLLSPIRGTVIEKLIVRDAMVKPGEMLYRVANLESVWVYLDIYESDLPWVQYGQSVEIQSEAIPGRSFTARVWFINPVLNEETRTVKVLINIDNRARKLKPGMYVSAVIRARLLADGEPAPTGVEGRWSCPMHPHILQAHAGSCPICGMTLVQIPGGPAHAHPPGSELVLAVPVTAVLDSGTRKIVYVERTPGQFAAVEIVTGPRIDDAYSVLDGLDEGAKVATRGNFLLDSQFQIRGLPSLFYSEGQTPAIGHLHGAAPPAAADSPAAARGHDQSKH